MLPEVLCRHYPNPVLQTLGKTCNYRVNVAIPLACLSGFDSLDDNPVLTIRLPDRDDE